MKKIIAFILAVTLMMSLAACSVGDPESTEEGRPVTRFQRVEEDVTLGTAIPALLYVDMETGVLYLQTRYAFTALLNTDGTYDLGGLGRMTCREKLANDKPYCIQPGQPGGCFGCPHMYGYLKKPDYCSKLFTYGPILCKICWDREIPEEGTDRK